MTAADIRAAAEAAGTGTDVVLQQAVADETVLRLGRSKFASCLRLATCREAVGKRLTWLYRADEKVLPGDGFVPGQVLSAEGFGEAFSSYIRVLLAPDLVAVEADRHAGEGRLSLSFSVSVDELHCPLIITLFQNNDGASPEKTLYRPAWFGEAAEILSCPVEDMAARDFAGILSRLTFASDPAVFAELYALIGRNACDGTGFSVRLRAACQENHVPLTVSRLAGFHGLAADRGLKARWKGYCRHHAEAEKDWRTVMDRLSAFLDPVWEAALSGQPFFGDWMPELSRYLYD